MPEIQARTVPPASVAKPAPVLVLRVGSHPLVYAAFFIMATAGLVFFLLIVPAVRALQPGGDASTADANDRYAAAVSRLEAEKKVIGNVASLTREQRDLLAFALPAEADTPGLSVLLHAIAASAGVRITGIDASNPAPSEGAGAKVPAGLLPVDVAVSVDGLAYAQVKLFLAAVDDSLRLMDVRSMNYSPGSNAASFDVRTYYLK